MHIQIIVLCKDGEYMLITYFNIFLIFIIYMSQSLLIFNLTFEEKKKNLQQLQRIILLNLIIFPLKINCIFKDNCLSSQMQFTQINYC